ncbi:MAG: hypothetical protein GX483_04710 [Actinomycetaceae bacterium]|nr:hypothetical protein [Actinomycetaceae bacterium]
MNGNIKKQQARAIAMERLLRSPHTFDKFMELTPISLNKDTVDTLDSYFMTLFNMPEMPENTPGHIAGLFSKEAKSCAWNWGSFSRTLWHGATDKSKRMYVPGIVIFDFISLLRTLIEDCPRLIRVWGFDLEALQEDYDKLREAWKRLYSDEPEVYDDEEEESL